MAIIKCKMCGGDLLFTEGASTAECEFCGSLQTVPKADNEKKLTLFARANRLRAAYVISNGVVCVDGDSVDYGTYAVRPALWIDLNS